MAASLFGETSVVDSLVAQDHFFIKNPTGGHNSHFEIQIRFFK